MNDYRHHHHRDHAPGHAHPPLAATPSLFRLPAWQRLALSGALVAVLWIAVMVALT
ncbi:MAG: hypothetical protein KJZ73_04585 [Pseudorhodoplanes sp.]|nr:hypothetical protein [Pseudorhodoplanes sp.]MBW7949701.1 hypothetical protein [Pseudorhodoplanes sp.]MCL4710502.1 hypothetical protein [Pseudorhodoplanes sp.]GIK81542.1 MAG: hypothetical protein BroJett024_26470 [Alphaproteobacteria bacterium]